MKRIHAFEFEDLSWFPDNLRNYATDFLQFGANTFDIYKELVPILVAAMRSSENHTVIDVASGGGGGLLKIAEHLKHSLPDLRIVLTDFYPNLAAFRQTKARQPDVFEYVDYPVNAMDVPAPLQGFRTQFLSFHHFRPHEAKAILQNAVNNRQAIGIFEAQQRDLKTLIQRLFSPVFVWLATPFIRPFRLGRLLFTYLIPIIPLFVLWDGVVSVLRTYTAPELQQMVQEVDNHELFDWKIDVVQGRSGDILYLLGLPRK